MCMHMHKQVKQVIGNTKAGSAPRDRKENTHSAFCGDGL